MNTTFAFEAETGIAMSTARRRTGEYAKDGAETLGQFLGKSPLAKQTLSGLRKGGA
jgi:hypothetical protein